MITQKDVFDFSQRLEKVEQDYLQDKKESFIGKNFLDALDEIAKTESDIQVVRQNVTFITHYPKRTKRPNIEIEKGHRENLIHLPVLNKENYSDYNASITDIVLTNLITRNPNLLESGKTIGVVTGLYFILDDSEELIIEN